MKQTPFLIKQTNSTLYPYILEPLQCDTCSGSTFGYTFGSAFVTIIIGVFIFAIALSWNNVAQEIFEDAKDEDHMVISRLNYAFLITVSGLIISTLVMYYVTGEKW